MREIKIEQGKKIYDLFDKFLEEFVIRKQFCLFDDNSQTSVTSESFDDSFNQMKDCFIKDAIGDNTEEMDFWKKLEKQFDGKEEAKKCFSHINWLWAFSASDMTGETKNKFPFESLKTLGIKDYYKLKDKVGIGNASPRQQKYKEEKLLIELIGQIWGKKVSNTAEVKTFIVSFIEENKFNDKDLNQDLPMKNALLHLCDPDKYEPIFSNGQKGNIVKAFNWIIPEKSDDQKQNKHYDKSEIQKQNEQDANLLNIREQLESNRFNLPKGFSFYDEGIRQLWQIDDAKVDNLDDVQKLEYKQAMVLYGPPGTSKTYYAKKLAVQLLERSLVKLLKSVKCDEAKKDLENQLSDLFLKKEKANIFSAHVDSLQMHINYTYENFVGGVTIKDRNCQFQQGYIYNVCQKAREDKYKDLPYVVILDEINRTDISRVFGEIFTAMEYRGNDFTIPMEGAPKINIPKNLFFIGTMNEIDFSVERIDFALRRRFVWVEKTYNEDILRSIITEQMRSIITEQRVDTESINAYCKICSKLNDTISAETTLGPDYKIGHAFFADITKILEKLDGNSQTQSAWDKARKILWQISIEPTLKAYCGAMDEDTKKHFFDGIHFQENKK